MNSQHAFITGASEGIGKALAFEYAKRGYHLLLVSRRMEILEKIKAEVEKKYPVTVAVQSADVTDLELLKKIVSDYETEKGFLDVVIPNAGLGVAGNFENLNHADYQRQFDVNIFGVLNTIAASLNSLKKTKGRLCLIGSTSSYLSTPGQSAYSMSKYAVRALAETLYLELSVYGISVTLINPGFIATDIRMKNKSGLLLPQAKDPAPSWLMMPVEVAAKKIFKAVRCRRRERALTIHSQLGIWLSRFFPGILARIMRLAMRNK